MYYPLDGRFYQSTEDLRGNENKKLMENMKSTMKRYNLAEVYLGFKNMVEIIHIYEGTNEKHGERFQSLYLETVSLANRFDREGKWSRLRGQQVNQNNIPSEMFKEYWQSTYRPYCCWNEASFDSRMNCGLISEVVEEHYENKINQLKWLFDRKWDHFIQLPK